MTKQEILKAIENGENVWVVDKDLKRVIPYNANRIIVNNFNADALGYNFEDLYKTQAEAEHYLHHANVTRTETLPFLTWEEFLKETRLNFIACDGVSNMILYCCNNTIYLVDEEYPEFNTTSWELTEENFYKAYDECVRLFKGE